MARQIDTDPSYLTVSSPIVTAYPFTVIAWFNPSDADALYRIWGSSDTATFTNYWGMYYNLADKLAGYVNDGTTQRTAKTTNAVNVDAWNMAAIVYASATDRTVILNADFANEGTNTTSSTPSSLDNTSIGALLVGASVLASGIAYPTANIAVWDVALTDNEITALYNGTWPNRVRPSSLLAHWPLWGNHDPEIVYGPKAADGFQMTLVDAPAKANHFGLSLGSPTLNL